MGARGPERYGCPSRAEYARGCRCDGCKTANNEYQQRYRDRQRRNGWYYVRGYKVHRGY